jgi:hypothetical protein
MRTLFALLAAALCAPLAAHAEKVDTPPGAMRKGSTHVIVGRVQGIYTRTAVEGKWRVARHLAEVEITAGEKGALAKGTLTYVRYWRRSWVGPGMQPPSTGGHRGLPKEGETLRIYLVNKGYNGAGETKDGGLDVYFANGFERLKKKP